MCWCECECLRNFPVQLQVAGEMPAYRAFAVCTVRFLLRTLSVEDCSTHAGCGRQPYTATVHVCSNAVQNVQTLHFQASRQYLLELLHVTLLPKGLEYNLQAAADTNGVWWSSRHVMGTPYPAWHVFTMSSCAGTGRGPTSAVMKHKHWSCAHLALQLHADLPEWHMSTTTEEQQLATQPSGFKLAGPAVPH